MTESLFTLLEATGLATGLRQSTWAYPLINSGHIFGVALLVGAILPLDLRLIGFWRSVPLLHLWRVLTPVAASGLGLAILCGLLLFSTRATEYAVSPLFWIKMILILCGLLNVLLIRVALPRQNAPFWLTHDTPPSTVRICAALSILFWVGALLAGRMIGYF